MCTQRVYYNTHLQTHCMHTFRVNHRLTLLVRPSKRTRSIYQFFLSVHTTSQPGLFPPVSLTCISTLVDTLISPLCVTLWKHLSTLVNLSDRTSSCPPATSRDRANKHTHTHMGHLTWDSTLLQKLFKVRPAQIQELYLTH